MNLLLLFSAILASLTGLGGAERVAQPALQIEASAERAAQALAVADAALPAVAQYRPITVLRALRTSRLASNVPVLRDLRMLIRGERRKE